MVWNPRRGLLGRCGIKDVVSSLPAIAVVSDSTDLSRITIKSVNLPLPSATGNAWFRTSRPLPRSICHPDALWNLLKCGSIRAVLIILAQLLKMIEDGSSRHILPIHDAGIGFERIDDSLAYGHSLAGLNLFLLSTSSIASQTVRKTEDLGGQKAKDLYSDLSEFSDEEEERSICVSGERDFASPEAKHSSAAPEDEQPLRNFTNPSISAQKSLYSIIIEEGGYNQPISGKGAQELQKRLNTLLNELDNSCAENLPIGWTLTLALNRSEYQSLLKFVDFIVNTNLALKAENVDLSTAVSGWEILHDALTDNPTNMIVNMDMMPIIHLLLAVARTTYSINPSATPLTTDELCWGLLVEPQEFVLRRALQLTELPVGISRDKDWTWNDLSKVGAGFWLYDRVLLENLVSRVARDQYNEETRLAKEQYASGISSTMDLNKIEGGVLEKVAFWYCLGGKQGVLSVLFRKCKNETV